jgi:hypothetical protein
MASLTSQLIISLIDRVSPSAKVAAGSLKQIGAAATQLGQTGSGLMSWGKTFENELNKLKLSPREFDRVRESWEQLSKSLKSGGPMRASKFLGAQEAWQANTLENIRRIRREYEWAHRAQGAFARGLKFGAGMLGVGGVGYAVQRGVRFAAGATADYVQQDAHDYLGGLSAIETAQIRAKSLAASAVYPEIDATTLRERLRDMYQATGSMDKTFALADSIARAQVVLQSLKGKEGALNEMRQFGKALDSIGKLVDPGEFQGILDGYIRALGVEGADLNMGDLYQVLKMAKSAGVSLSSDFLTQVVPGLVQDMGAARVGTALGTSIKELIGDRGTKKSRDMQQKFGIRDERGNIIDRDLLMSNPLEYSTKHLIPAMDRNGIDSKNTMAVAEFMNKLFSNQLVADIYTKIITQIDQYARKREQYARAPGLEAADHLRSKDPYVALEGTWSQLRNFAAILASDQMQNAVSVLNGVSSALAMFSTNLSEKSFFGDIIKKMALRTFLPPGANVALPIGAWLAKLFSDAEPADLQSILLPRPRPRPEAADDPARAPAAGTTSETVESGSFLANVASAAAAGASASAAYGDAVIRGLDELERKVDEYIGRITGKMNFRVNPSISPMFAPAPSNSSPQRAAHNLNADWGIGELS